MLLNQGEVNYKDIDFNDISKHQIGLMGCQIELILKSLEFYLYTYKFIYPRRKEAFTSEEELRISLVKDTYLCISTQIQNSNNNTQDFKKYYNNKKKIA